MIVTLEVQGYRPLQGGVLQGLFHLIPGLGVVLLDRVAQVEVPKVGDQPDFWAVFLWPGKNWDPKPGALFFPTREWSEGLGLAVLVEGRCYVGLHWTLPKSA